MPARLYDAAPPRPMALSPRTVAPAPPVSAPPKRQEPPRPVLTESKITEEPIIGEEDLKAGEPTGSIVVIPPGTSWRPGLSAPVDRTIVSLEPGPEAVMKEQGPDVSPPGAAMEGSAEVSEEAISTTRPEDLSPLAQITPQTPPQHATSLRLTEEGKRLLEGHNYDKALAKLERAISVDSRNRFAYYYLAEAHYLLAQYRQSLDFLDIAESTFAEHPLWLAQVYALRGENYLALGFLDSAELSYAKALELDPANPVALQGIARTRARLAPIP